MSKLIVVAGIIVIIAAGFMAMRGPSTPPTPPSVRESITDKASQDTMYRAPKESSPSASATDTMSAFTMAEVAKHSDETSCYIAIGTKVYDVTDYIPNHPGGDKLLRGCGKELTAEMKHPGGSFISAKIAEIVAPYQIGTLTQ